MPPSVRERIIELLARSSRGLRQADIARAIGASRSYVSEVIRDLVRRGIVKRVIEDGVARYTLARPPTGRKPGGYRILRLGIVWSSEYPFITLFAKKMRDRGISIDVIVYSDALDTTFDLVRGTIDLALSPLVTQFLYASLTNAIRIIGGGATGGALVLENTSSRSSVAVSSKASTMDLILTRALSEIGEHGVRRVYGRSGEEIMYMIATGRARYAAIWEPLATRLARMGMKRVASMEDYGIPYCCTLAVNTMVPPDIVEAVKTVYEESISEHVRNPLRGLEWYSITTGIPVAILRQTLGSYTYNPKLDPSSAAKTLRCSGIKIPEPSTLRDYIA